MSRNRLSYLYYLFLSDAASVEELAELKNYFNEPGYQEEIMQMMDEDWNFTDLAAGRLPEERAEFIYNQIISQKQRARPPRRLWRRMAVAAALIVAFGGICYYFIAGNKTATTTIATTNSGPQSQDVASGSNKAILKLATGRSIVLNDVKQGESFAEPGSVIVKKADGQLVYIRDEAPVKDDNVYLNTIEVPRGGEYKILLPDGTDVYINSGSSLIYPTRFSSKERVVTLSGEAYFEVAKDRNAPFKVNVLNKQSVDVLGTSFNISAYSDDAVIKTTLVTGAVKIVTQRSSMLLKPGEMASNNTNTSQCKITDADTTEVVGWKNGYFIFNNESLKSILTKISRWYDVDVTVKGNIDGVSVTGNYNRKKTLQSLLKGIELSTDVHFLIKNRNITVIRK